MGKCSIKNKDEADAAIRRIGQLQAHVLKAQASHNLTVQRMLDILTELCSPLDREINSLVESLLEYATKNRAQLTEGKKKTIKFPSGQISFREGAPSLNVDEEAAVDSLYELGLSDLVVQSAPHVDKMGLKNLLKENPTLKKKLKGVTMVFAPETFRVKPDESGKEIVTEILRAQKRNL